MRDVQWVECGPGCPHPECLAREEQRKEAEFERQLKNAHDRVGDAVDARLNREGRAHPAI